MGKLVALWRVFRKGEAVANPAAWKAGQIGVTAVAALLAALAQAAAAFGLEVPVDENQFAVVAVVNIVLTVATTRKIGLPAVGEAAPGAGDGRAEDPY